MTRPNVLADSAVGRSLSRWPTQSLADGAAGIALLHIERALTGRGSWSTADRWIRSVARAEISAARNTGLFFGAPAVSFVLHAAGADGTPRYRAALAALDRHVIAITHRRVDAALARIQRGDAATFAEYDLFRGLTGLGAHLLRHHPGQEALGRVLGYLVRLVQPVSSADGSRPGWWVGHDPRLGRSSGFPGGHANLGMAHGIAGPLALLAQARRRGVAIDGQVEAIEATCAWLDGWRFDDGTGPGWPQWITWDELRAGRIRPPGRLRPSWCYGTPGLARAHQLAAIAVGDRERQRRAEDALAACLADAAQLGRLTDAGLCHGWSGVYQTAWRAARDALTPTLSGRLPALAAALLESDPPAGDGLLEGAAGPGLAIETLRRGRPPTSGWDACLLID